MAGQRVLATQTELPRVGIFGKWEGVSYLETTGQWLVLQRENTLSLGGY